jgi:hypothetical protein
VLFLDGVGGGGVGGWSHRGGSDEGSWQEAAGVRMEAALLGGSHSEASLFCIKISKGHRNSFWILLLASSSLPINIIARIGNVFFGDKQNV